MNTTNLVLASGSKYRQILLKKLCLPFVCFSPDVNETAQYAEKPQQLCTRLAKEKAMALIEQFPNHIIIASDQVAIFNGQQLCKPGSRNNTIKQLLLQSGNTVQFYTSICVLNSKNNVCLTDLDICSVSFKKLSKEQIERYVDLDKPFDCAGGFKSEALGIALFERFSGDDPNALIGLPLIKLIALLQRFDIHVL